MRNGNHGDVKVKIIDSYLQDIKDAIDQIPVDRIEKVVDILHEARVQRKQIFLMGNGGSASTASHFVSDLTMNRRKSNCPSFRVFGLSDSAAILSAYANSVGYENVFAQQLANLLQEGDIVIAISRAGNSLNILNAIEYANKNRAITIGFTGLTGGKLRMMAQHVIHVPNASLDQVEDIHLMLEHMICQALAEMDEPLTAQKNDTAQPAEISDETDALVKALFNDSLPVILNSGAHSDLSQASNELLSEINAEIASKVDMHDLLSRTLTITVDYLGAVGGSIFILNDTGEVIDEALAYAGRIQEQPKIGLKETIQHGLAGWVLENRQPVLVKNTKEDSRWLPRGWEASLDLSRSAVCVPLLIQDRVLGILTLTRMQSNPFTMEDLSLLISVTLTLSCWFASKAAAKDSFYYKSWGIKDGTAAA